MLRPGQMSPLSPWLRHCLQDRIISLLQVKNTLFRAYCMPMYVLQVGLPVTTHLYAENDLKSEAARTKIKDYNQSKLIISQLS